MPEHRFGHPEDDGLCRVRFVGGPLSGATLDLPLDLVDALPGQIVVTADGTVFDCDRSRPVPGARVIEQPACDRPPPGRAQSRPTISWRSPFL